MRVDRYLLFRGLYDVSELRLQRARIATANRAKLGDDSGLEVSSLNGLPVVRFSTTRSIVKEFSDFLVERVEEVCRDVPSVEVLSNLRLDNQVCHTRSRFSDPQLIVNASIGYFLSSYKLRGLIMLDTKSPTSVDSHISPTSDTSDTTISGTAQDVDFVAQSPLTLDHNGEETDD